MDKSGDSTMHNVEGHHTKAGARVESLVDEEFDRIVLPF